MNGNDGKPVMTHKQILIIRELGAAYEQNIGKREESGITTWCCVNQGRSAIKVNFDKNVFDPTEVCKAFVNVDNSQCNIGMRAVRLALEQELTLTSNDNHRFTHTFTLANKSEAGVPARGNADEQRLLELDLKTIRFVAPEFRMKHGVKKPVSIEDKFMLENMAPKA